MANRCAPCRPQAGGGEGEGGPCVIPAARPGARGAESPCQNSMISPSRGSSGRRRRSWGGVTGSSCVNHLATLDDPPDMIHPKMVEKMSIVGDIANNQIGLFTDFERAN